MGCRLCAADLRQSEPLKPAAAPRPKLAARPAGWLALQPLLRRRATARAKRDESRPDADTWVGGRGEDCRSLSDGQSEAAAMVT